jgi:hypothetical protein
MWDPGENSGRCPHAHFVQELDSTDEFGSPQIAQALLLLLLCDLISQQLEEEAVARGMGEIHLPECAA